MRRAALLVGTLALAACAALALTARARTGIPWRYLDFDRDGWVEPAELWAAAGGVEQRVEMHRGQPCSVTVLRRGGRRVRSVCASVAMVERKARAVAWR